MDSIGAVVAAIVLAMLLVGGGAVAQLAYEDTGDTYESFNETFDAGSAGSVVELNESNRDGVFYGETVTVRNASGEEYLAGQDYEWNVDNGTLTVLDGDLVNATNNTIAYDYQAPSGQQTETADTLALLFNAGVYLPLILVVLLVLLGASALGGLT